MRRLPPILLVLPVLGVARLLPEHGLGLGIRLAAATACLLLPGALISRALGRPDAAPALAWSLGALLVAMAVMFAARSTLWLALLLLGAVALVALPFAARRPAVRPTAGWVAVLLAGGLFGVALWHVAGSLGGDALFHLARARKLEGLDALSLRSVDEFADGGLHPGYAFPLWHGLLALVARLAGVDPSAVVLHEASVLAPLSFLLVYEAGVALFRSAWAALAVLLGQVAVTGLAAGHGGAYTALALPATASRQLLGPAVLALFFTWVAQPSSAALATLAVASVGLALVHPTYAVFVGLPLAGFVVARALLARTDLARGAAGLAALAVPTGAVLLWLLPIVRETASHTPSAAERQRALAHYAGQLDVFSAHSYRLAPEVFGRTGAVAVAALVLLPLTGLAGRRRWAAFVLGGSLVVLALMLIPFLFSTFADAVSLSQARRAAGFLPFAFAFAGGAAVLARLLRVAVLPVALAAGIALQLAYSGDFGYRLTGGGPALATWIAAIGGAAALAAALGLRRRGAVESRGPLAGLAAAVFVLPVAVHGFANWSPREPGGLQLTPGLVAALRDDLPKRAVVYSDLETSYRVAAYAPVYVAAAPPAHVADTEANRPYDRREDVLAFFRSGGLEIPRRYGAGWIVVDRARFHLALSLPRAYADSTYVLYRL